MAEDKDKILETPEVPEVEAVEAIVEEGVDTAPEVTEEEILVVSETDKPSPADEPVESGETITEQEVEAPVLLLTKKQLKNLKFLSIIMQMSHFWQTTVSNQE